jgi:hypothetical protein
MKGIERRLNRLEAELNRRGEVAQSARARLGHLSNEEVADMRREFVAVFPELAGMPDVAIAEVTRKIEKIYGEPDLVEAL